VIAVTPESNADLDIFVSHRLAWLNFLIFKLTLALRNKTVVAFDTHFANACPAMSRRDLSWQLSFHRSRKDLKPNV
jgi:hypothetical protein